jgi:hypothetical protein
MSLSPPLKLIFGSLLSKRNSILTGKKVLYAPASNTDSYLLRDTCVSSIGSTGLSGAN